MAKQLAFDDAARKSALPAAAADPVRPAAPQPKPIPRLTADELRAAALAVDADDAPPGVAPDAEKLGDVETLEHHLVAGMHGG